MKTSRRGHLSYHYSHLSMLNFRVLTLLVAKRNTVYGKFGASDLYPTIIRMSPKFIRMNLKEPKHLNMILHGHSNVTVTHSNEINGLHKGHSNDKNFIRMLDDTKQRLFESFKDSFE